MFMTLKGKQLVRVMLGVVKTKTNVTNFVDVVCVVVRGVRLDSDGQLK